MGQIYHKEKEDVAKDAKTMSSSEFMERLVSSKRIPDRHRQEYKTESTK